MQAAQIQHWPPAKAVVEETGDFDQQVEEGADAARTHGQAGDAHARSQKERTQGDADGVRSCTQQGQ